MPVLPTTSLDTAAARAASYRLFSALFCLPDEGVVEPEDVAGLAQVLERLGSVASEPTAEAARAFEQFAFEDFQVEYSRLFVGPFALPAPPYGSVHLEEGQRLMGDSTLDVIQRYREAGVDVDPVQQDMPDHIAIELEFMGYLAHLEAQAISEDDDCAVTDAMDKQIAFLGRHLAAWVPKFSQAVIAGTESPYFQALARALEAFVSEDLARVTKARGECS